MSSSNRVLLNRVDARATNDGDGVKIHRVGGQALNQVLDPFLMIDEINSDDSADYIGGFPEHPHRGFETITYMKAGRMRHRDHMGNEGLISAGGVQWMTAGRGVMHSEMPEQESGLLQGFQLWLNLPAASKMKPAAYCDLQSSDIAEVNLSEGGQVRAIAGEIEVNGKAVSGSVPGLSDPLSTQAVMLDVTLSPGEHLNLGFKAENPAWVYVYDGSVYDGSVPDSSVPDSSLRLEAGGEIQRRQMGVFSQGAILQLQGGAVGARALVLSGRPLKEPIVQYGPFVMNSSAEIEQAFEDYRSNRLAI